MDDPYGLDDVLVTATPTPTRTAFLAARQQDCAGAVDLPANGVLMLPGGQEVTLTAGALFRPACTPTGRPAIMGAAGGGSSVTPGDDDDSANTNVLDAAAALASSPAQPTTGASSLTTNDLRDPFYASTFPQCYALAATTVVSYTLVIMLLITPRAFLDGGGIAVLGRRRFTDGGASGGQDIGGRPWLQKVAALGVAVSLTIASVNTFGWAQYQYSIGEDNAKSLQDMVMDTTELKAIAIISDSFLWLAQAQTLTRLFPRQREKIIIKWTAFALVSLDVIFQSLNSFQYTTVGGNRPENFTEAIPALSYLFQLTLGVLYAAWVIYYSIMKRRFAFYHTRMKNICLVAILALMSIMVPIVFFILDISQPEFTGWGSYVRWVGAAAASTIVWEWVERIEALERDEKKDGILGREVFDGDEMTEVPASDLGWPRRRKQRRGSEDEADWPGDGGDGGGGDGRRTQPAARKGNLWPNMSSIAARYRSRPDAREAGPAGDADGQRQADAAPTNTGLGLFQPPLWPARPAPAATPVSRTDTTSADSTVYAVRYHPLSETPGPTSPQPAPIAGALPPPRSRSSSAASSHGHSPLPPQSPAPGPHPSRGQESPPARQRPRTSTSSNNSGHQAPPPQPQPAALLRSSSSNSTRATPRPPTATPDPSARSASRWDIRSRFEDFAMTQAERLRERIRPTPDTEHLPVTVIPAPRRPGAALAQVLEEEAEQQQQQQQQQQNGQQNSGNRNNNTSASGSGSTRPDGRRGPETASAGGGSLPRESASPARWRASGSGGSVSASGSNPLRKSHV